MKNQSLIEVLFRFYGVLYVLIYIGFILLISLAHSSINIISILAILVPFISLLLFVLVLSKSKYLNVCSERKTKNKLKHIAMIGSIPTIVCMVMLGINEYKSSFNTNRWLTSLSERVYMVDNLLSTFDLKGKTKSEVIELLGAPTDTGYFKTKTNIVYYLGNERGLISIDSEWLVIDFDEGERVVNYSVRTD
ncbi:hypothetical protein [Metabacillus niabensis]|uniref:Phosphoglycerol transferase MdoB-like AlkP superfamily enzyme n=1 Tax=Metabacillus niabensis TaxID=324854 RepID=A0ABT9Z5X2_9BACI|nr:hypothetical protein [Metabacillus niabensis]MDQ0227374.1 phosphoglycerol transferase MdoB-like AlkP superfamily enzyme [Metabacillus niabensis]